MAGINEFYIKLTEIARSVKKNVQWTFFSGEPDIYVREFLEKTRRK